MTCCPEGSVSRTATLNQYKRKYALQWLKQTMFYYITKDKIGEISVR